MTMNKTAVERGAEWLDSVDPSWWKRVELKDIDLELYSGCVLGQLYGSEVSKKFSENGSFGETHGFILVGKPKRSDYLNLSSSWAAEIELRKNKLAAKKK